MIFRRQTSHPLLALLLIVACASTNKLSAQNATDSLLQKATLENLIDYAIKHQPLIQQSTMDESITETVIKSKLADWYPQINFAYNLQHNFQVQTSVIGGNPVKLGVDNISNGQFTLKQNIFNRDVLLAGRTANDVRKQAKQTTASNKIDVTVNVSKAFYSVLATMQQIQVTDGDIIRLERSLKDAYNQYVAGVADKTDYKRTTIALNNAKASKKTSQEYLKANTEYLKTLIGYPTTADLAVEYDSLQLENEVLLDTLTMPEYTNRIEYQLLETQRRLLKANVDYNKWSYLPTVSANGAYNLNYQTDRFSKLYGNNFPNSFAGLTLSLPIFQGFKRVYNTRQAELELKRTDWDIIGLKNNVNAEYNQAMAAYKSNLANYLALKENVSLAQEVYDVIQLQYKSGIKTYLEVITSETDLRTARLNYINALYQLLSSKIDVRKTLGEIK
jgi:outer membrane protein